MIVYDSLEKALAQLEKALGYAQTYQDDRDFFEQFRNSVIQTFEYSFELSFKLLKRTLAESAVSDDFVEGMSFNDVIRLAARQILLDSPEAWFQFRTARNKTSHGYEESFAQEAYLSAQSFLQEGRTLLTRMRTRGLP